jgi:hypothetical protein
VKSGGALKGTQFGITAPSETAKKSLSKRLRGAAHEGRKSRAVRKKNAPNAAVNQRRLVMTDALFDAGTVAADAPWSWVLRNTAVGDGVAIQGDADLQRRRAAKFSPDLRRGNVAAGAVFPDVVAVLVQDGKKEKDAEKVTLVPRGTVVLNGRPSVVSNEINHLARNLFRRSS